MKYFKGQIYIFFELLKYLKINLDNDENLSENKVKYGLMICIAREIECNGETLSDFYDWLNEIMLRR